jgi:hypothetical protein
MDSLQNGDSLVMLWLVSWLTRHSLHRIVVTRASAFGKMKAAGKIGDVTVFLSRDQLSIVRAKPDTLVQPFGRCIVHLDQEL